jgi:hypothetical protein
MGWPMTSLGSTRSRGLATCIDAQCWFGQCLSARFAAAVLVAAAVASD